MGTTPPADRPPAKPARRFGGWGFYVYATAALVIGAAALLPLGDDSLRSPSPASNLAPPIANTYERALGAVGRQHAADDSIAVPEARSILLTHGSRVPRAAVLLHGLTNSPRQFKPFAERLFAEGYNVWVPRLPRHGERTGGAKNLERMTAEELSAIGDASVNIGRGLGDSVIVVGLSAGGTVAVWVAQERAVDRAVIIAPALELAAVPSTLTRPLIGLAVRAPDVTHREAPDTGAVDREPGWTTRGIAQMLRLGEAVRDASRKQRPAARRVTFLLNANDHTVKASPVLELAARWASRGTPVGIYEIPDSLRLAHDVIDPREHGADTAVVYRVLDALVNDVAPAPWVHRVAVTKP
jgi:esterase/lipase